MNFIPKGLPVNGTPRYLLDKQLVYTDLGYPKMSETLRFLLILHTQIDSCKEIFRKGDITIHYLPLQETELGYSICYNMVAMCLSRLKLPAKHV